MPKYIIKKTTVSECEFEIDINTNEYVNPTNDDLLGTIKDYMYREYIEAKIIKDTYEIVRKE